MDPSCLVSTVQAAGGGVMVWGIFSWHSLGPLVPIEHRCNATAYLSIVADHVHPFMTTMYPTSDGYFQQDNAPCHKAGIISDWFLEHDNEFAVLKWPPQSPDLNPIEHLWDVVEREIRIMDVQPTNLRQLCDAIISTLRGNFMQCRYCKYSCASQNLLLRHCRLKHWHPGRREPLLCLYPEQQISYHTDTLQLYGDSPCTSECDAISKTCLDTDLKENYTRGVKLCILEVMEDHILQTTKTCLNFAIILEETVVMEDLTFLLLSWYSLDFSMR
ncbi:hypothetical protein F2P79_023036 [Pimephales promelas]|nr:hypothetical protein F2P79_023036 [Pimephales promelas]